MVISNKVKEKDMPDYILLDDLIDDMIDDVSYVKLNTYLDLDKDKNNDNN